MATKGIERTAYHEAGHAIACHVLRVGFKWITIIPDPESQSLGHLLHSTWPNVTDVEWDGNSRRRIRRPFNPEYDSITPRINDFCEKRVIVCYAGGEAEKIFAGIYNHTGARSDRENAIDLLSYMDGFGEVLEAHLHYLRLCAKSLVESEPNWQAIQDLASALLELETISGRKAREIILASFSGSFSPSEELLSAIKPLPR